MKLQGKYYASDYSHYQKVVDPTKFPAQGLRFVYIKASDGYHMPDKNGNYDFAADRHTDAFFADNFDNARAVGLVAAAYHFCRWDRPLGHTKTEIAHKNLEYFKIATAGRVVAPARVILDMEQAGSQLQAVGLTPAMVTSMAKIMVTDFIEEYGHGPILYTGSYWWNVWITDPGWFADRCCLIEADYVTILKNRPLNPLAAPTPARGFINDAVVKASDFAGKLFAWQFTDKAKIEGFKDWRGNIPGTDGNLYDMPKEELYKFFFLDGAVDPPTPPEPEPKISLPDQLVAMLKGKYVGDYVLKQS